MLNVFLEYSISLLLLDLQRCLHLFEFVSDCIPEFSALCMEEVVKVFHMLLISLECLVRLNQVIDLNQAFCPHFNFPQHFSLHSDIVVLMVAEQCAVGAYALSVINADDLKLPSVLFA
jgi:hypothetical protein